MTEIKPSATLILLRQTHTGMETLLLKRNKEMAFGSAWVFPGGKIDPDDYLQVSSQQQLPLATLDASVHDHNEIAAAFHAAVRESREEAGVDMRAQDLVLMSCWTTPILGNRPRFRTWFFVGEIGDQPVVIDGNEMIDYRWIQVKDAVDIATVRELGMLPPTYNTLVDINQYSDVQSTLAGLRNKELQIYNPKLIPCEGGYVSLYEGDAGYETGDVKVPGARHRLRVDKDGYCLEKTV
jgi:8-oxo-dGTP pyrophosphatase MutT (NUDIX family)